jgi:hypothetical protein
VALGLTRLERDFVFHRYEHVLKVSAPWVVCMRVTRRDCGDAEVTGQMPQGGIPTGVSAREGPLQLDEEALGPEGASERGCGVRVLDREPVAGAAGEADEALVPLREQRRVEARVQALVRMGCREEAAEVRVAARSLDEEGDVGVVGERRLGAGDGPHADGLGGVGELERAVDAVVVGKREGGIAEVGGADGELLGKRGAVEEGVGGVRVELDVAHPAQSASHTCLPASQTRARKL